MGKRFYVGNLSEDTTPEDLEALFAGVGVVESVSIMKDHETGESKGFAYVEMETQQGADDVIKRMNGQIVRDREIKLQVLRIPTGSPAKAKTPTKAEKARSKSKRVR